MHQRIIFVSVLLFASSLAIATPPGKPARYYTQANGEKVMLQAVGSRQQHWFETRKGDIVVFNSDTKNYEYAEKTPGTGALKASGVSVGELTKHPNFKPLSRKDLAISP